jgi:hypothetical protein
MKTIIPAILLASLAITVYTYCSVAHADGYQPFSDYYGYNGGRQTFNGYPIANPIQSRPGLSPGEFGALYILQQQQMIDMQRQQLQMNQRMMQRQNAQELYRSMSGMFPGQ